MPHHRNRHIETIFKKSINFSPILGLFGHRQVGKTTFVSSFAKTYRTLDLITESTLLRSNPLLYLENRKSPFAIDEAQLEPSLFPALKEAVRQQPKPGQFIITGSVRFSSRKKIRESLTGRIIAWEMIPMDLAEIYSLKLSQTLATLSRHKTLDCELTVRKTFGPNEVENYLKYGGLPGLFAIRNETARRQKLELQIETLLERDLRLIIESKLSYDTLRRLLVELANQQLQPFEINPLSRATQISVPTLMNLMRALEAMYLIRWIPSIGSSKKKSYLFEDQGEATYLQTQPSSELFNFVKFLYANLRTQWHYQNNTTVQISQMRSRSGQWIPLVIQGLGPSELAIIPVLESKPAAIHTAAAASFLKKYPTGKVLLVHPFVKTDEVIHPRIRFIPWQKLV